MKTPVLTLSISEFLEELEIKKVSYPYAVTKNSVEYNEIIIELANTLSEELVLLSAALSQGIEVSQEEVKARAEELKKEYPEGQFTTILLEKAIPLRLWQKRLKKNMILEKVIEDKIKEKVEISPEEIVEFYKAYNAENKREIQEKEVLNEDQTKDNKGKSKKNKARKDKKANKDKKDKKNDKKNDQDKDNQKKIGKRKELKDEQELIVLLRLQKTQKIYEEWIKELEAKFPVEINKEKLIKLFKDDNK